MLYYAFDAMRCLNVVLLAIIISPIFVLLGRSDSLFCHRDKMFCATTNVATVQCLIFIVCNCKLLYGILVLDA